MLKILEKANKHATSYPGYFLLFSVHGKTLGTRVISMHYTILKNISQILSMTSFWYKVTFRKASGPCFESNKNHVASIIYTSQRLWERVSIKYFNHKYRVTQIKTHTNVLHFHQFSYSSSEDSHHVSQSSGLTCPTKFKVSIYKYLLAVPLETTGLNLPERHSHQNYQF